MPIDRVFGPDLLAPTPPLITPELSPAIPFILCKGRILKVADRRSGDSKGLDLNGMGPLLVVKHKGKIRCPTEVKCTSRNLYVPLEWPAPCSGFLWDTGETGAWVSQGLPHVSKGFSVHIFRENYKPMKIRLFLAGIN
jgi:hypothetical protein